MALKQKSSEVRVVIDTPDDMRFRAKLIRAGEKYPDIPGLRVVWECRDPAQTVLDEIVRASELMDRSHGNASVVEGQKTALDRLLGRHKQ